MVVSATSYYLTTWRPGRLVKANMYQTIFESLGLSPNEGKIYETLLEIGESSISDIATRASIHRRNVYDAIQRLIDKGLVFQVASPSENSYNAVDPDKLMELMREKEESLSKVLPEMKKKFGNRVAPEEAYIYRGYEGQKNVWRDMLRIGKDIYIIGGKAQWFDPKLDAPRDAFYRETKRKKMLFHLLLDHELKERIPGFTDSYPGLQEHRYLPRETSTSSIILIFGDYVVSYAGVGILKMSDQTTFFVVHSKDLADGYRSWFNYMWNNSKIEKLKKK